MIQKENILVLKKEYGGFREGTVLLKGDVYDPLDPIVINGDVQAGQEYFDMSTEISTGHSYSLYDIPSELLKPANEETSNTVIEFLDRL